MAHYAVLDENNIVINVITGRDENEVVDGISDWEAHYTEVLGHKCVRTSYNTSANKHILGGTPFRKNYAGIGMVYDEIKDAFYNPHQPFLSWTFDDETCTWVAPKEKPAGVQAFWNEETLEWDIYE